MKRTKVKRKKVLSILIMLVLIMSVSVVLYATEPETTDIVCVDMNLYDALVKDLDDYIYKSDRTTKTIRIITTNISSIKELKLAGSSITKITNLTGLEYFTSLENLNLSGNNITSVEPISNLLTLKKLDISRNESSINDLDTLTKLTNLIDVNFASSKLTNIDFMSTYSQLQILDVSGNSISSLDSIAGILNLQKLNIANNASFNRFQTNICCHPNLIYLDISGTAVQVLDGIETNLRKLKTLNLRYLDVELDPIVARYKDEETDEYYPYLDQLENLDISYTTRSITFKNLSYLTNLKQLYMKDVVGKWKNPNVSTKLSLNGIYELQEIQYINLSENNISSLDEIVYKKYKDDVLIEKKWLGATEIYLQNNNISDITPLVDLEQSINVLNLSYNKISEIRALDYCRFSSDAQVDLRYQDITLNIFEKDSVDQYIILPSIFQESKRQGSFIYSEDTGFLIKSNNKIDEASIKLNEEEPYLQPNFYNVIISKSTDKDDVLTLELTGNGMATGSKVTFVIGTSTSYVDSILFRDHNLCQAIKDNLAQEQYAGKVKYLKNAHLIMNINNSAIKNIDGLHLASRNIYDLSGMENFTGLTNLILSNNDITTIDQLQYCTNMLNLEVPNNNIGDNNTAIQKMTKLQSLDLSNTNMSNINSIEILIDYWTSKKKYTLTNLKLSGNGFTNKQLERIQEIPSLTTLIVANNKLNEVESFRNLSGGLSIFDISQNQIEDITSLKDFTNLISLNLGNNKIEDISSIANCAKLNELDISANKIEDISSLGSIAASGNLVILNMNNNEIKDVSAVDRTQINQLLTAENQRLTQIIPEEKEGTISIELPQIFKASNNINSRFYDAEDIKLSIVGKDESTDISEYCTLSSDGLSLQINIDKLEEQIIVAKIQNGNADNTILSIAGPLKGTVVYNPYTEVPTNQNVIARVTFNRNVKITSPAQGTNYISEYTHTFENNGDIMIKYSDEYGFEGTTILKVENIDKVNPKPTVLKEIVDKKVVITIEVDEEIALPNGWEWTSSENKQSITKTYENDANETIKLIDLAGNESNVKVEVTIDKTAPKITGVADGEKYSTSVTPQVEDQSEVTIKLTKDGSTVSNYKVGTSMTDAGLYVLTATDAFGNTTTVSFEIEISDIITSDEITVAEQELVIKNIDPKTTVSGLKSLLEAQMDYTIIDKNGNVVSKSAKVGTGYQIKMPTNKIYTLIVKGDCNGDGDATITDIFSINSHRLKVKSLSGIYLQAADVNDDSKADIKDIFKINSYRLQGGEL